MSFESLRLRANVIKSIRSYFDEMGFLEVETPFLIPANAPEEHINPVTTLSSWQLHTSPELCMKRLLCNGHKMIYQICHCWRSAEKGSRHLEEFTMLEWYRADSDYSVLMDDCVGLLRYIASKCCIESGHYQFNNIIINPFRDWQYITVQEAFDRVGRSEIKEYIQNGSYDEILTAEVEHMLGDINVPVFLLDYPAELAALARCKPDKNEIAERFELYVGGLELANGFSELNNSVEQRRRFEMANKTRVSLGAAELPLPEQFLSDLDIMPDSAGIALGVDRLVMLAGGYSNISDVVAFTQEQL